MKTTTLRKTTLATAVSLAMSGSAFAAHDSDDAVLFPIISTADSLTFITIVNDPLDSDGFILHTPVRYHFYYGFKAADAAQTAPCTPKDLRIDVSLGHLLQFEVSSTPNLPEIFGDDFGGSLSDPNRILPDGQLAFLIVESENAPGFALVDDYEIFGEAVVLNTASGLQFAYSTRGLSDSGVPGNQAGAPTDLSDIIVDNEEEKLTSWYPSPGGIPGLVDGITTFYHALPLAPRDQMYPASGGGIPMVLRAETDPTHFGAYARNEDYISGVSPKSLTCFALFPREELLPTDFLSGGWMSVVGYTDTDFDAPQSYMLHKIQSVPSSLLGVPVNVVTREVDRQ